MKQPELGLKIASLRKKKGLTQDELATHTKLNLRTIQRIEKGQVTPRSYTLKILVEVLDYNFFNDSISSKTGRFIEDKLELLQNNSIIHSKTRKMKRIIALLILLLMISTVPFSLWAKQKKAEKKFEKVITQSNIDYVRWFNNGEIDSLLTLYRKNAVLMGRAQGHEKIGDYFQTKRLEYKFISINTVTHTVSDTIGIESGVWTIDHTVVGKMSGEYMTEWRYRDKKWLIQRDISTD